MVQSQGFAGGGAQQDLVYNLRVTANMEGARLAAQSLQQLSKQTERSANEMARAFGPRLTAGMQQVRQRLIEQGKASIAFGQSLDQVAPSLGKHRKELTTLGVSLQAAGVSGKNTAKVVQESGQVYSQLSTTIGNTTKWYEAYRAKMDEAVQAEQRKQTAGLQTAEVTKQNIANMQQWNAVADEQIRRLREATAVTGQAGQQSAVFGGQVKTAVDTMGSFTGEATMAQKAGQGMILSFSGAQAAAGNYQQALFGLGFSMMFVGKAMLGWPLIIGAAATAMTVGIPKLIEWMKGTDEAAEALKRFGEVSEGANERLQGITTTLAGSKGELAAVAEGIAGIMEEEGTAAGITGASLVELTVFTKGLSDENKKLGGVHEILLSSLQDVRRQFGQGVEGVKELEAAVSESGQAWTASGQVLKIFRDALADNIVTFDEYLQLLESSPEAAEKLAQSTAEITAGMREQASTIRGEAMEALSDFTQQIADSAARAELIKPFKIDIEGVHDEYEVMIDATRESYADMEDAVQEGLDAQIEAIRDGLQNQTTAMREAAQDRQDILRDALKDELDAIRDAAGERQDAIKDALDDELDAIREQAQDRQDAIKDALDDETEAIKDAADERVDSIRDQLKDELDAIKDAAGDRVDAVKDAASDEIDVHKERISALRDMERSLAKELSDLASRRQELIGEAMTAQAEIAALEAAQAQFGGDDPRLAAEIALRRARLESLEQQDAEAQAAQVAAQEQANAIEQRIENEEAAIEAVEDRRDAEIEAIEDARDAAIEAAKDAAEARIEAEEDARDAAIEAAKEAAEEKIKADKKATDAAIEGAQDAAEEKIKADQTATDILIGNAQDIANEKIKEDQRATTAAITEAQREARERIKEANGVATEAIKEINRVRDEAIKALELEEEERVDNIELAQDQAEEDADRAIVLRDEVLPGLRDEWVLRDQILQIMIASTTDEKERARLQEERNRLLENYIALTSGMEHGPEADISVPYGPAYQRGGIVPGPPSRAVPIIAHGEEAILRPDQFQLLASLAARGAAPPPVAQPAPSGPVSVSIVVNARSDQDMQKLKRVLNQAFGRDADISTRSRRLSGR